MFVRDIQLQPKSMKLMLDVVPSARFFSRLWNYVVLVAKSDFELIVDGIK